MGEKRPEHHPQMASTLAIGAGIAVAAFLGRAGLVALRQSRAAGSAFGRAFYKGGFEATMNRREAPTTHASEPPRSRRKPLHRSKGQRSESFPGERRTIARYITSCLKETDERAAVHVLKQYCIQRRRLSGSFEIIGMR